MFIYITYNEQEFALHATILRTKLLSQLCDMA
jgi:hypothetical protein